MIHEAAGSFLLRYRYGERSKVKATKDPARDKAAVIIETRDNFWLPMVLRNFLHVLKDWNFYFIGPSNILKRVHTQVGGDWNFVNVNFPSESKSKKLDVKSYNKLLLGTYELNVGINIWEHINEENILVFQSDCICFREPSKEQMQWDYIGALCGNDRDENNFVMNGGLSFRKKSAMTKICKEMDKEYKNGETNEDIVFTDHMRKNGYSLPSVQQCHEFAIETGGDTKTCVGLHGTEKYWISDNDMHNVMNYVSKFMF